jgi:hypothetical protein
LLGRDLIAAFCLLGCFACSLFFFIFPFLFCVHLRCGSSQDSCRVGIDLWQRSVGLQRLLLAL